MNPSKEQITAFNTGLAIYFGGEKLHPDGPLWVFGHSSIAIPLPDYYSILKNVDPAALNYYEPRSYFKWIDEDECSRLEGTLFEMSFVVRFDGDDDEPFWNGYVYDRHGNEKEEYTFSLETRERAKHKMECLIKAQFSEIY